MCARAREGQGIMILSGNGMELTYTHIHTHTHACTHGRTYIAAQDMGETNSEVISEEKEHHRGGREHQLVESGHAHVCPHQQMRSSPGCSQIDLPCVRANIERECARVARGEATFEHVVEHTIAMFRRRFVHFGRHAHRLPSMLAVALAADPFAASGGEHAELGNPGGLAAAAAWRAQRRH